MPDVVATFRARRRPFSSLNVLARPPSCGMINRSRHAGNQFTPWQSWAIAAARIETYGLMLQFRVNASQPFLNAMHSPPLYVNSQKAQFVACQVHPHATM